MPLLLTLQNAQIGFKGKAVLRDISLTIHSGASMALVGENGSGKTTLLKTLAGILPLLSGSFQLAKKPNGEQVNVGYIPQRAMLNGLFSLKAREVVEMGTYGLLRPWQMLGPEVRDRVSWSMNEMDALSFQYEPYALLSGGQQQRVLIARALASEPDILLLDEPLASLDQQSIQTMLALFTKIQRNTNLAIIWADHALPTLGGVLQEALSIENRKLSRKQLNTAMATNTAKVVFSEEAALE